MTCEYCCGPRTNKYARFCSKRCAVRARPTRDKGERFWAKVTRADGCWPWRGGVYEFGYGCFFWGRTLEHRNGMRAAHRVAYELTYGQIPVGMCVLHSCDNPPCCRPDHLFLGTDADNSVDKVQKERHTRGVTQTFHKLTDDDVHAIRTEAASGMTRRAIAKLFNVSAVTITKIVNRQAWKHVV